MTNEFITIESHFGVPNNFIRPDTRNRCSKDLVEMINILAKILYPNTAFEIYFLPPEKGSYTDSIKITAKEIAKVGALVVFAIGLLTYLDSRSEHLHNEKMWVVDDTAKCLSLKQQRDELSKLYEIENLPEEKIKEACGNIELKKLKNDRYKTLQSDDMVSSEETVIKDVKSEIILKKTVDRKDFGDYIEKLPENEDYTKDDIEGKIELISLVVKQKKEGKGIQWRGIYYGNDIREKGIDILLNGEEIYFYMQDEDFKKKINNHEITFSSDDEMEVILTIKGHINMDIFQNKSIYIKKVKEFNKNTIQHEVKADKNKIKIVENQSSLFDE